VPNDTTDPGRRPATPSAPVRRGGRLAALDGFRLIAALFVVIYHYAGPAEVTLWRHSQAVEFPGLHQVADYGWLGVQFFFIISGFVICMSSWDRSLKDFFVSRTVRLFPMYWAAVIISALVVYLSTDVVRKLREVHRPASLAELLLNFTMGQSSYNVPNVDGVYWTLWVELRFYLLFAVVVWMGVTYRRAIAFCALWLIASVITATIDLPLVQAIVQPTVAPYFIAGILLYLIHRFGSTPLLWGLVGFCWILAEHQALTDTVFMSHLLGTGMKWKYSAVLIALFFAAVSAVALGWLRWAKWRWLTVAGALTYPLYLLHQDIGLIIIRALRDDLPAWPLLIGTIAAMLLLAYLGHRLIERPLAPRFKRLLVASLNMNPPSRIAGARRATSERPADGESPGSYPPGAAAVHAEPFDDHGPWPDLRRPNGPDPAWLPLDEPRDPDPDAIPAQPRGA
jgi:peptidoglycan/LPS O-acetylase OafA/YrhL